MTAKGTRADGSHGVDLGGFSIDEVNRALRVLEDDREETLAESRAALEREGLVEHNGLYRNGQPVYVITAKGRIIQRLLDQHNTS